jgi:hypothetical protein
MIPTLRARPPLIPGGGHGLCLRIFLARRFHSGEGPGFDRPPGHQVEFEPAFNPVTPKGPAAKAADSPANHDRAEPIDS